MQQTFQCNRCGAQNYVGQPHCWNCQAPFQYNCPHCRSLVETTMANCPYCNLKLNFHIQTQPQYTMPLSTMTPENQPKKKSMSTWKQIYLVSGIVLVVLGTFGSIMSMKDFGNIQPRLVFAIILGIGEILYVVLTRKK